MKIRKSLNLLLTCGLALTLCACGDEDEEEIVQIADAQQQFGCNVINVYNAGEYIGEDVVENFEIMYNAKVNYDTFESNEMLYTKLLGGNNYDVLVPSDYMIEQLMDEKMLQKINQEQMTNIENLDPDVVEMQKAFDPELEYSVPYFWGSVGIVYNRTEVDEDLVKEQGWEILRNTDYAGRILFYDSQRDAFMIAFKALGYSMNTDNSKEIQEAYEWLRQMNATMEPQYVTDEVLDAMVNNEASIAVMYSGDAAYAIYENMDLAYLEPDTGTNIWVDAMVIPANSTCPGLANEFINYCISDDVQFENSEYVGYTSVNTAVVEELAGEDGDFFENEAYTPRTGYEKDEVFHYNEELKRQLSDLYTKVKISAGTGTDTSEEGKVSPVVPFVILAGGAAAILFGFWYHKKRKYRYRTR